MNSNGPRGWDLTSYKLRSYVLEKRPTFFHNKDADWSLTIKLYENPKINRYLSKNYFFYRKPNSDYCSREWLLYSPIKKWYIVIIVLFFLIKT